MHTQTHECQRGFTLLELLITAALTAILAATAYPSFQAPLFKARRLDGIATLLQLQLAQEQWRSGHAGYAGLTDLHVPATSGMQHYRIAIDHIDAGGYTMVATATGAQAGDRQCRVLRLTVTQGDAARSSGPDALATNSTADNRRCWGL